MRILTFNRCHSHSNISLRVTSWFWHFLLFWQSLDGCVNISAVNRRVFIDEGLSLRMKGNNVTIHRFSFWGKKDKNKVFKDSLSKYLDVYLSKDLNPFLNQISFLNVRKKGIGMKSPCSLIIVVRNTFLNLSLFTSISKFHWLILRMEIC